LKSLLESNGIKVELKDENPFSLVAQTAMAILLPTPIPPQIS
jgi:hypothetical protein